MSLRKLTPAQVHEIASSREQGTVLAQRYGVSPALVSRIRNGAAWSSTTGLTDLTGVVHTRTKPRIRKLTAAQALAIAKSTEMSSILAAQFGVSRIMVQHIRAGRYWGRVTGIERVTAS